MYPFEEIKTFLDYLQKSENYPKKRTREELEKTLTIPNMFIKNNFWEELLKMQVNNKNSPEIIVELDSLIDKYKFCNEFYIIKAQKLINTNLLESAKECIDSAIEINPNNYKNYVLNYKIVQSLLAKNKEKEKNKDQSQNQKLMLDYLNKTIGLNPFFGDIYFYKGRML